MRKRPVKLTIFIIIYIVFLSAVRAQTGPGQYTEEAPLGSWNLFGPETAASLGTGFCLLARTDSVSLAYFNPALLTFLPSFFLSWSGSFNQAQLFSYWLVNTGVITTSGNLTHRGWQLDHFGLSLRTGGWTVGLEAALVENYGRPGLEYRYVYNQLLYNQMQIWQTGYLSAYIVSLARNLGRKISIGVGLSYERGRIERSLDEFWPQELIQLLDYRHQKITGFRAVAGLSYKLTDRLLLGLSFSPPYFRKAKSSSSLSYQTPLEEIEIQGQASDRIKRPLVLGLGGRLEISPGLKIFLEAVYFGWAKYSFSYFGEEQARNFRNTIRLSTGLEYLGKFRFLGRTWSSPYFLGLAVDPQPGTEPESTYYYLTFGSGLGNEYWRLSFSTALGLESGSGHKLKRQKVSVTLELYPHHRKVSAEK